MCLARSRSGSGELQPAGRSRTRLPPSPRPVSPAPSSDKGFFLVSGAPEEFSLAGGALEAGAGHTAEAERKACAGRSHPLLYLPVSEVPLFPSHTPCLLFHRRRECTHRCHPPAAETLGFSHALKKINPLSEEGDTLLFNRSLTRSFDSNSCLQGRLPGPVPGAQTCEGRSAPSSGRMVRCG